MKHLVVVSTLTLSFFLVPWWLTFAIAFSSLLVVPGYSAIIFALLLDAVYVPFAIPYATIAMSILVVGVLLLRKRMLAHDSMKI